MDSQASAVVTGTSTGIGWATAKVLLDRGWRVFGTVRKQADADRLQAEFGSRFTPLILDLTDQPAVEQAAAFVGEQLGSGTLTGLVNNAGVVVFGPLLHLSLDKFRYQLEVNLVSTLSVTQAFARYSVRAREGRAAPAASSTSAQ